MNQDLFKHFLNTNSSDDDNTDIKTGQDHLSFENIIKSEQNDMITNDKLQATEITDRFGEDKVESNALTGNDGEFSEEELYQINNETLNHLKEIIPVQKFSAYFENNFTLINIDIETVKFSVSTPFIKNMIEKHYLNQLAESILSVLGKRYNVQINLGKIKKSLSSNSENILKQLSNDNPFETFKENSKLAQNSLDINSTTFDLGLTPTAGDKLDQVDSRYMDYMEESSQLGITIDPRKTFDNFIIGPSNNMACATAKAVVTNPGKTGKYPSLYFYSNSGLGKTHLLHAVANGIKDKHPALAICMITARDFMKEMINAMKENKMERFQKKYSERIDVLMIDDVHELKNKKGTQNEFFHVFNALYNKGKQLIFTSDKPPKEIDGLEERIKTRLQWGLVIDIQLPDLETRIAILKRKAEELDLYLQDDVLNVIACSIKSSIRELEGSLIKLSAYADVMKVQIDSDMVKDLLVLTPEEEAKTITIDLIAKTTAHYLKIPLADLKSRARSKEITRARHIAMYLSHKVVGATLQEIGKFYGGRDHTSVMHATKKIKEMLKTDNSLSKDLTFIESNL